VAEQSNPNFAIQRIYIKDISFESPETPKIFKEEWAPEVSLDLQTKTQVLESGVHEVILDLRATAKQKDKVAFLIEVQQAGIFTVQGFEEDQQKQILGSMCPSILYPFAREVIASLVMNGGFPPLLLAPVNFDAIYAQHLKHEAEQKVKENA